MRRWAWLGSPPCTWTTAAALTPAIDAPGSPPCTWGQRGPRRQPPQRGRFTPMHMGTTGRLASSALLRSVHPHAHGDNGWSGGGDRGEVRFTPMHMGTTSTAEYSARVVRFTPMHMGTTGKAIVTTSIQGGSPPCTWGQRVVFLTDATQGRFTPMHMGTTMILLVASQSVPVHPHAHGDNGLIRIEDAAVGRFTPMHMGTSPLGTSSFSFLFGSPPCTWGQLPDD